MTGKEMLFTLPAWYCWLIQSLVLGGVLFFGLFVAMQAFGVEVTIGIPTIERTFKK